MDTKVNFYTLGRDIAIKKKFPSKSLFSSVQSEKDLDYRSLLNDMENLYKYLVNEYEKNPELVPLSSSWILDNYYILSQQEPVFSGTFKPRILKRLPLSEYDRVYFQIYYITIKYLEACSYNFSEDTLIPFLRVIKNISPI